MPVSGSSNTNAYSKAMQYLHWTASKLRDANNTDVGSNMQDHGGGLGDNICCANFVSGVLQSTGQISKGQHNNSVSGLYSNLKRDGNWQETSLKDAKPGDMVTFAGEGSSFAHTEIFAGWKGGKVGGTPLFVGSNNVNKDGTQSVTEGTCGMPVTHVMHFKGGPEVAGATTSAPGGSNGSGGMVTSSGGGSSTGGSGSSGGVSVPRGVTGAGDYDPTAQGTSATGLSSPTDSDDIATSALGRNVTWAQLVQAMMKQGVSEAQLKKANPKLKADGTIPKGTKISLPAGVDASQLTKDLAPVATPSAAPLATAPAGTPSSSGLSVRASAGVGIAA